jgi:hypothetical protein
MNYEEAKAYRDAMEERHKIDSIAMKEFDKHQIAMGLIPDHIRETPEYQAVKKAVDKNFSELRNFNGWFVKTFKKEIQADRKNRYKNKAAI